MERLTHSFNSPLIKSVPTKIDFDFIMPLDKDTSNGIMDILNKLAAYEDAEEQGRLLMLPCGVGDVAYHIWYEPCHHGETYPDGMDCDGCMDECDIKKAVFEVKFQNVEQILAVRKNFGSYYFLNREDAEKELSRLA